MGAPNRGPKVPSDAGGTKTKKGKSKRKIHSSRGGGDSLMSTLLLVGAGVALVPLLRRAREWLDAKRGNDTSSSSGQSAFSFGKKGKGKKGKKAAKGERATKDAPMKKPPGAATAKDSSKSTSMARSGKMQSNKKHKARKAERKEERQEEQKKDHHKPGQLPSGGGKTIVTQGNNVPKDEDIVGGEAGKTFTTTSHVKVPTWYAKVREERGND